MNLAVSSRENPYISWVRSFVPIEANEISPSVTMLSARTHARGTDCDIINKLGYHTFEGLFTWHDT